ncbi:MAG: ABC transporter ATP-binding protein [bacterium]|nr:ABC transporter ATP-binding protein [bacterium]
MSVISIRNLTRTYVIGGDIEVQALRGVDLDVEKGEFVAIMGPSGSGKSTMMNILGCLDKPTAGTYILDGENVSNMSNDERAAVRNQRIGFVFQGFNLLARTTALENVELPLMYRAHVPPPAERRRLCIEALERVGLGGRVDHVPTQMSGGEQQRVAIARALVTKPAIILADEPTGNLDSKRTDEVMALFNELNSKEGITTVMVTHEPEVAVKCKRVVLFKDGKIIGDGTPDEVLNKMAYGVIR